MTQPTTNMERVDHASLLCCYADALLTCVGQSVGTIPNDQIVTALDGIGALAAVVRSTVNEMQL